MTPLKIRLRELREAKGLSQQDVADRAKMRQATVSQIESGKAKRLDVRAIERLCAVLGVEPGELLALETSPRRRKG